MQQFSQRGGGVVGEGSYRGTFHASSTLYVNAFQIRMDSRFFEVRITKTQVGSMELRYGIFGGGALYIRHDMPGMPTFVKFSTRRFDELGQALKWLGYEVDVIRDGIFTPSVD